MAKFKVAPGGSVMNPKGTGLLMPGDEVPGGLHPDVYKSLQSSRHIVEVQNTPDVGRITADGVEKPPGANLNLFKAPAITMQKDGESMVTTGFDTSTNNGGPIELHSSDASPWVIKPELLEGKTVDELNAMIRERDPKATIFETPGEAAAFLSQDYKPKS